MMESMTDGSRMFGGGCHAAAKKVEKNIRVQSHLCQIRSIAIPRVYCTDIPFHLFIVGAVEKLERSRIAEDDVLHLP